MMSSSDVGRNHDGSQIELHRAQDVAENSASGSHRLFNLVTLPDRKLIASGSSLHDPKIVELCARLRAEKTAFTLQPVLVGSDLETVERLDEETISHDGITPQDRRVIESGELYSK